MCCYESQVYRTEKFFGSRISAKLLQTFFIYITNKWGLAWFKFMVLKGVDLGYGRQLYFQCLLKYMVICAFENPSKIPSILATQIVYIGYGQFKKNDSLFLLPFHSCALVVFINVFFCILLLLITVCCYYMLVPTKYQWNISFLKKLPSKYVVKNARSVTHFVKQTFFQ